MKIGILQCGHFPTADGFPKQTYGDLYARMLAGHGFEFRTWSVVDMDHPASIHDADGWLISGSKHGAYEDLPFIPPLEDFLRRAYSADVPLVGICFGHQVLAKALGGHVEKFDGGWSVGRQTYCLDGDEMALNAWHQDQVTKPPADARTIGTSAFCEHAALAYKGRAFSVQPHPEFDAAEVQLLLHVRRAGLDPDMADAVQANLPKPLSNDKLAARIAHFFKETVHV
jgi:GMP synthase (glutamine-hydrolysing)